MTVISQVRVAWTGLKGLPGVSTFYFDATTAIPLAGLRTLFDAGKATLPSPCVIQVPNSGLNIESTTGQPVSSWTSGSSAAVNCTGLNGYAAPVGGIINWTTGVYVGGRQLRGKTFLVPLITSQYDGDGTLVAASKTLWENAAATFLAGAPSFVIWSRKNGTVSPVTASAVPDKAVVLRSRRD